MNKIAVTTRHIVMLTARESAKKDSQPFSENISRAAHKSVGPDPEGTESINWVRLQKERRVFIDYERVLFLIRQPKHYNGSSGVSYSKFYGQFKNCVDSLKRVCSLPKICPMIVTATGVIPSQKSEYGTFFKGMIFGEECIIPRVLCGKYLED